mgnify:FL=1
MPMGGMARGAPPMPPLGMGQGPPSPGMGEMIRMMAEVRRKSQPIGTELVSQAIELLDQAREADSKMAPRITMAIGLLENGPDGMDEMGGRGNPKRD